MKIAHFRKILSAVILAALAIFTLAPVATPVATAQDDHGLPAGLEAVAEKTLRTADGRLMVMIELTEAPVVVTEGGSVDPSVPASASAISRSAAIMRSQDAFVSQTAGMSTGKFDVLGRTTYLINTVSLAVTEADLAKIAQLSEVKNVFPVIEHQLDLGNATGYTSTSAAWSLPGNYAGQGQVVAVIDSGVDFTNPDFGGNGAYPAGGPNSAPRITAPTFGTFPLGAGTPLKVVGGYD
ncbi:MAG: hypothetical protein IT322_01095, partial [Anaerolineae bacterium]|nr:hypothetical protein [Anaerolineae bacterium]